jgi:hypothetical protein
MGNRLAYCRRLALDLANIEFAQADILELASLGRWQAVAAKLGGDIPAGPEAPAGATQGPLYAVKGALTVRFSDLTLFGG